jgi:hypothetical protein
VSRADLYFSLIHARTSLPNQWIERFYHRLDEEVRSRAAPMPGLRAGSLYHPTEGEARRAIAGDYPEARVLVPLYTREFLHTPPPDFRDRLHRLSDSADLPFVHPVLWDAYQPARSVCGLAQARSLGEAIPEYEDCGLASICRLNAYRTELTQIVELLAERLVRAAEHPHQIPEWIRIEPGPVPEREPEARFWISVVRPPGRDDWTPFGAGAGSVIGRALQAAHRMVLLPEVVSDLLAPGVAKGLRDFAGVLLLDPGTLGDPMTRPVVERLLRDMPSWMGVVLVTGPEGDDRAHADSLVEEARDLARYTVRLARDAPEFEQVIAEAINRARHNFLRGHPRGGHDQNRP